MSEAFQRWRAAIRSSTDQTARRCQVTEEEYQRLCRALAEPTARPASDGQTEDDVDEIVRALERIPPVEADQALEDALIAILLRE